MDFRLDETQQAVAAKVAGFVADRVAPVAAGHDRAGRFADGFLTELGDAGLMALGVPVAHGGDGHGAVTVGLALEELARADITACWPVLNAALIAGIIERSGTPEQQAAWLPGIARGRSVVALVLTEPGHGTDAAAIELAADPDRGGGWLLEGTKTSIMAGTFATHGLVFARTGAEGARGITAFYVPLDDPRIRRTRLDDLGNRAGGRATLEFDRVPVPASAMVGRPGTGFVGVMRGFDYSRALIGLMAVAAAGASLDEALEHCRTRTSFGVPLGHHQGVSFPLVDHATRLRAGRLLALEALWRKDSGLDHRTEANMVKSWVPSAAVEAAQQALLTMGHLGWTTGRAFERRLRDLIGTQIADGTINATRLVVARQLLGRDSSP